MCLLLYFFLFLFFILLQALVPKVQTSGKNCRGTLYKFSMRLKFKYDDNAYKPTIYLLFWYYLKAFLMFLFCMHGFLFEYGITHKKKIIEILKPRIFYISSNNFKIGA